MASRYVTEVRVSAGAIEELHAHGLDEDDPLEVSWDNPAFFRDKVAERDLMIGRDDGGRLLTIVVEWPDRAAGICDVVTGWPSDKGERTAWQKARPQVGKR